MRHDALRHGVSMPQCEHGPAAPPEIQLHHEMTAVAGDPPGARRRGGTAPTGQAASGGDNLLRRVGDRCQLRTGRAAAGLLRPVGGAHLAAAIAARGAMLGTGVLAAHGTRLHLIRCEYRRRLLGAGSAVLPAHQAARCVGAVQVARAVHVPVHHAHGLMGRADRLAATRALRHLVDAHRLVGPALAVAHARGAQAAAALGRVRPALLGVAIADEPPAAAAGLETRRAGGVVALGADTRVGRAVLHPAGLADARVLLAGGLLIHTAPGDAVVRAEVLGADGAAHRARVTGAVPLLVPAHDELRRE